jgi:Bax protein
MDAYRASDMEQLKDKLELHPVSIVLGQAALESGWGSSRFFIEANNAFGVWAFGRNKPRIEANRARGDKSVYLRKYHSLIGSVLDYYRTIARGPYSEFRHRRGLTDDPLVLTSLLYNYSESRDRYVRKLQSVIRDGELEKYDRFIIDPAYLK